MAPFSNLFKGNEQKFQGTILQNFIDIIMALVAWNKSSLLLKNILQNAQTLQLYM
jgi:hypothetical protein